MVAFRQFIPTIYDTFIIYSNMKFLTLAVIAALGFVGLAQNDRETRRKEALEKAQKSSW